MDIQAILGECKGGEVIDLSGITVNPYYIRNVKFEQPVTLMGGTWLAPDDEPRPFRMDACAGIHIEEAELQGTNRTAGSFMFHSCHNMAVRKSSLSGIKMGIQHHMCDTVAIEGNTFRNLRLDAIRGGGGSNISVLDNYATEFFPENTGGVGDHPDFIQFWPLHGSTNDNLVVRRNTYERGEGLPIQGVFMRGVYRDKEGNLTRPMYGRVTVMRNVISGGLYNGICVSGASGVVSHNHVYMLDDQKSWLRIEEFEGDVLNNTAPSYIGNVDETQNTVANVAPVQAKPEPRIITVAPGEEIIIRGAEK